MGSKRRIAKHILPIILKDRKPDQWYIEPFVGGGNMIENVDGKRMGFDINGHVIEALKVIRDNPEILPKDRTEFTEEDYRKVKQKYKDNPDDFDWMVGYVGFALSFGGIFFSSFRRSTDKRDYINESYRAAVKQSQKLKDAVLFTGTYNSVIPSCSIIYCDPPYRNTTQYEFSKKFNHDKFFQWCRNIKNLYGHAVFVSEYEAPSDFECVWEKEICSSLGKDTGSKKAVERLFTLK